MLASHRMNVWIHVLYVLVSVVVLMGCCSKMGVYLAGRNHLSKAYVPLS